MSNDPDKLPVISIVINNYNYGRFLRECIDSALGQTYPYTEVIVVDDGSTDASREVIESYGQKIVPILKQNGGQASAFNTGFAASEGEVIIFLDADDLLLPETAEIVAKAWRPRLSKVQYRLEIVDTAGRRQGVLVPSETMPGGNLRDLVLSSIVYTCPPTSGIAHSRHVLDRLLPMPEEEWRISADGYLISLSPFFGDVAPLQEVLGLYRVHDSNNYAMGVFDLGKLRRILVHDVQKQELLREFGEQTGIRVGKDLALRIPGHVKARIASLRLDSDKHPFPEDKLHHLVLRGIGVCLQSQDVPLRKKPLLTVWFVLVAVLPKPVVEPLILFGLMPRKRSRVLALIFR